MFAREGLVVAEIPLGLYELPRRSGAAYAYRIGHLAWIIHEAH